MTRARFNRDRAAAILADAEIRGDRETALSWDTTVRTIENYRARLLTDPELVESFQKLRKLKQARWIDDVPVAIAVGIEFLKGSFMEADKRDPDAIAAVSQAIEMLADLELTREMIDRRLES